MSTLEPDTGLSRRRFLRGAGAAIALPFLPSLLPRTAWADEAKAPVRLAFCFVPNGMHMQDFTPKAEGRDYELPYLLEPLAGVKDDLLVLSGLAHDQAKAHGDGPGDHARSGAVFLTAAHPVKTAGSDIRVGISVDQLAAKHVGKQTRFPSLELGCEGGAQSGQCDSGYSCAYSSNLSWRTPTTPAPKERNPRLVFERLFTDGSDSSSPAERAKRLKYRRSILDAVAGDARRLRRGAGRRDADKLEEYLTSLREIERRIERAEEGDDGLVDDLGMAIPQGVPKTYGEHIEVMSDLMILAFRTDTTRVASFMVSNAGSGRSYRFLDVPEGHHPLSHHGGDEKKHEKIKKINRWHLTQLASMLERFKAVEEGEGNLLDNTLLLYGSCIGDGNRHNHDDLPILLAGRGGGAVDPGRHLRYEKGTPVANLFLRMLEAVGAEARVFGDSTGRLAGLKG